MTQEHLITPPPELMEDWLGLWPQDSLLAAAQWGADQELEACCEWLDREGWSGESRQLRAARRPKPPSLKEQVLSSLTRLVVDLDRANMRDQATILEGPIRRALEQLDD